MSKRYDEEFKRQAVSMTYGSSKSVAEIARDLGISDNILYQWKKIYGREKDPEGITPIEKENQRLKKELADAVMERDILKKAVAIFSTHRK